MPKPKLILLDFDGTVVDSGKAIVRLTMNTLEKFNVSSDSLLAHQLLGMSTSERFKRHGVPTENLKAATEHFDANHKEDSYADVSPIIGVRDWLTQYLDVPKWIVTASPRKPVEESLRKLQLDRFFEKIISKEDLNEKSKLEYLRSIPSLLRSRPVWLFGDEEGDLQAGSYIGAITFLINNSRNSHLKTFADRNIDCFSSLLNGKDRSESFDRDYPKSVIECLSNLNIPEILRISQQLAETIQTGHSAYLAANGGSLAVARHFAIDVRKISLATGFGVNLNVLGTEAETLTAISNDNTWDEALSIEMSLTLKENDFVAILSTSGSSTNLVNVIEEANKEKARVVKLTPATLLLKDSFVSAQIFEDVLSVAMHTIGQRVRQILINPSVLLSSSGDC